MRITLSQFQNNVSFTLASCEVDFYYVINKTFHNKNSYKLASIRHYIWSFDMYLENLMITGINPSKCLEPIDIYLLVVTYMQ